MSTYRTHVEHARKGFTVEGRGHFLVASVIGRVGERLIAATLALAEQQRISNLIALSKIYEPVQQTASDDFTEFYTVGNRITEEIADSLGIKETTNE